MFRYVFLFALFIPLVSSAQSTGEIHFLRTSQLNLELPEGQEHLRDQLPTERTSQHLFLFTSSASLYKDFTATEEEELSGGGNGGPRMMVRMVAPELQIYQNWTAETYVEMREFLGKKFLISEKEAPINWKLSTEQEEVLGYPCRKATFQDSTRQLTAWYTTALPLPVGPETYSGLPGMILKLSIDDDETVIVATSIVLDQPLSEEINEPTKGKEMSRADYEALVVEKLKEMEAQGGSGIRVRTN